MTADADALPDDLVELVKLATTPSVSERLPTVDDFLEFLSDAERQQVTQDPEPEPPLDPLDAMFAGLLSFLSPCVLPLVPAYLGYLSGHTLQRS